jgi:bla regulator protein BlaR1
MNTLQNIFSASWADVLGWTLLHSLWQALAIVLLLYSSFRIFSQLSSQAKYTLACLGMLLTFVSSIVTFTLTYQHQRNAPIPFSNNGVAQLTAIHNDLISESISNPLIQLQHYIDPYISLIVLAWIVGTLCFSARLIGGYIYISKLRQHATFVNNAWTDKLTTLAAELGIYRALTLGQSSMIDTPMVIGYIKPIILVPIGMFNGLTTAELETIFLHELAHIRRHDYIINLLQSIIEVIFFFNPFVWIISRLVRREREYCCDDTVIGKHADTRAYAHALARLEESRISTNAFALSLGGNRNELLNRIKRIMERSFKPKMHRDRIIPVVVLVAGLLCASWLTINGDEKSTQHNSSIASVKQLADTTKKRNEKSAYYYKKSITTTDENGEPHEVIVEDFDGDPGMITAMPVLAMPDISAIPPIPALAFNIPAIPPIPAFDFDAFDMDTIPGKAFNFHEQDWEKFSEAFEEKFQEQFSDFYSSHAEDFAKMMKDLEQNFQTNLSRQEIEAIQTQALQFAKSTAVHSQHEAVRAEELAVLAQADAAREMAERQKEHADEMKDWADNMKVWEETNRGKFAELEKNMQVLEKQHQAFEQQLQVELVKDGYISKNEKITELHWSDDGDIEVNGKKIKDADKAKYNALHDKYFKSGQYHITE